MVKSKAVPLTKQETPNRLQSILNLLLISFLALYLELVLIRWLASEIRVFAYFKNFPLMAAFLGLGVGCAVASRRKILFLLVPALLSIISIIASFSPQLKLVHVFFPDPSLYQWSGSIISPNLLSALETVPFVKPLIGVIPNKFIILLVAIIFFVIVFILFSLTVAIFFPVGQKLGEAMTFLSPLAAYTVNIAGSLLGTLVFTVVSLMKLPPWIWLLIALPVIIYLSSRKALSGVLCIITIAIVFFVYSASQNVIWSPYYRISYHQESAGGYTISVDHDYHQKMLNLSVESVTQYRNSLESSQIYYDLPYQLVPQAKKVLIIGAGSGNDASAALRANAQTVVAVEIDPSIVELGQRFHPEQPYSSDHVQVVVNDARAYFHQERGNARYDLIVYGLVDSHTALSSKSSLRLEFYLYTKESIQEAISLLQPQDGVLVLNFSVGWKKWLGQRLYNSIHAATGQEPLVLESSRYDSSITYVCGPGLRGVKEHLNHMLLSRTDLTVLNPTYGDSSIRICSDDWPFLYLNPHSFPIAYIVALALMLISGWFMIRRFLRTKDAHASGLDRLDWHMFFMGAGFLLVETKNIIQLSLLFGATWVVNSVVFTSIFIMILLANFFVWKMRPRNIKVLFILLAISLFISYLMPFSRLTLLSPITRALIGGTITALPVLFSGLIFATTFRQTANADISLGSNILGALFGGVLEAFSLIAGIKALSLLAIAIYILAWYTSARYSGTRKLSSVP
jgi:spermidine synthase